MPAEARARAEAPLLSLAQVQRVAGGEAWQDRTPLSGARGVEDGVFRRRVENLFGGMGSLSDMHLPGGAGDDWRARQERFAALQGALRRIVREA